MSKSKPSARRASEREVPIVRGSKDHRDPEYLVATTTPETIVEWFACIDRVGIEAVQAHMDKRRKRSTRPVSTSPVYTDFEKRAMNSLRMQFQKNSSEGRTPVLTGPQLVLLHKLVDKAVDVAVAAVVKA